MPNVPVVPQFGNVPVMYRIILYWNMYLYWNMPGLHICDWHAANAMNFFDLEASQSNYGACLSAAGNKAEFLYSAFADLEMLQFNSPYLVPNIIRMALSCICQRRAKTIVVLVVCCSHRS
jgi:hypothetical protein